MTVHGETARHQPIENWFLQLSFVLYCSLLIACFIIFDILPYGTVSTRLLYLWTPHAVSIRRVNFLLSYAVVLIVPAFVISLGAWALRGYSGYAKAVRVSMAATAMAGFPLVCLYASPNWALSVELTSVCAALVLWLCGVWNASQFSVVLLLLLHYAIWFAFSASVFLSMGAWGLVAAVSGLIYAIIWSRGAITST